jgi:ankyrin repeat protein
MRGITNPASFITLLLARGADVNAQDDDGMTPLMAAARYGKAPEKIQILLSAGADRTAKSRDGKTALDLAELNPALKGTPQYELLKSVQ